MTAVAALLLGVVSFWTTARVSGLEDYLRSEIVRRNFDLNALADRSNRLSEQAERSEQRLSDLGVSTDRVLAASAQAQSELLSAQGRLNDVRFQVVDANRQISASQNRLGAMDREIASQRGQIDLYRRQRVYEDSLFRLGAFRELQSRGTGSVGQNALQDLRSFGLEMRGGELDRYYDIVRRDAPQVCQFLASYNPAIPADEEYPQGPQRRGEREERNGVVSYSMSGREYDAWTADVERWNKEWSEVSRINRLRLEQRQLVNRYVTEALSYCVCRALSTEMHGTTAVCSRTTRPTPRDLNAVMTKS